MRFKLDKTGLDNGKYNLKIYVIEIFGKGYNNFLVGDITIK